MRRNQRKEPRPTAIGDRVIFTKGNHRGEVVAQRDDGKFAISTAMKDGELSGKVWASEAELVRIHDTEPLDVTREYTDDYLAAEAEALEEG